MTIAVRMIHVLAAAVAGSLFVSAVQAQGSLGQRTGKGGGWVRKILVAR